MNYIQYLQAGGKTAPSIQDQVETLVKKAMSGDKKSIQQINEIIRKAKSGDEQAIEFAKMIQDAVAKEKGTQMQQAGGEMQPQQPVQQQPVLQQQPQQPVPQQPVQQQYPQYGNAPVPPPVPQRQGNTSLGTQMYGDSSAAPLSKNDYGAPENNVLDKAISGAVQGFGSSALSAIGSMRRGGKVKFFQEGGKNNVRDILAKGNIDNIIKEKMVKDFFKKSQMPKPFLYSAKQLMPLAKDFTNFLIKEKELNSVPVVEETVETRQIVPSQLEKVVPENLPDIYKERDRDALKNMLYVPERDDKMVILENKEKGGKLGKQCACKLERRGGRIIKVDSCTGLKIK